MPDLWVIDTSSIIEVRRPTLQIPRAKQPEVFAALTELVNRDVLVFPKKVLAELERQTAAISADRRDLPYEWARDNEVRACHHEFDYEAMTEALAVEGVGEIVDADKPGVEPADPYVLGLAYQLRRAGRDAGVITEDRKNAPDKIGLAPAVGLVGVPSVPMRAFLLNQRIWRVPS